MIDINELQSAQEKIHVQPSDRSFGGKMRKDWHELISQPQYKVKAEKDVYVAMRDRVRLAVDIYRPDAEGSSQPCLPCLPFVRISNRWNSLQGQLLKHLSFSNR